MEHRDRTDRVTPPGGQPGTQPSHTLHGLEPAVPDPAVEGTLLGSRYRVGECIGAGAMGVVWTAWDRRLGRTVAVKQLALPRDGDPVEARLARGRALREGRIAARVVHSRAIAVFDVVTHDAMPWLVMEYLPSRSLATVLAERGPMAPEEVAAIGAQIADALTAVHEAGIVHGDVKPGNVLLTDDGVVKLTDFGVSRASWDPSATGDGVVAGTPGYFAPEVARGGDPTPASDVFSLGATLYAAVENELVCGHLDNTLAVLHAMAEGRLRPAARAGVLGRPLSAMLRLDPAHRPSTALLHSALAARSAPRGAPVPSPSETATAGSGVAGSAAAGSADAPPSTTGPATSPSRSRRSLTGRPRVLAVAAASAVVLAAGVGAAVAAVDPSRPAQPPQASAMPRTPTSPPLTVPDTAPPAVVVPPSPAGAGPAALPAGLQDAPGTPVTQNDVRLAVASYYANLPGDIPLAWSYLSGDAQDASGGYDGYQRFWSGISSVAANDVQVDGASAQARLEFVTSSGRSSRETYHFEVDRNDQGRLEIRSASRDGSDSA